jgi:hypothetical protein
MSYIFHLHFRGAQEPLQLLLRGAPELNIFRLLFRGAQEPFQIRFWGAQELLNIFFRSAKELAQLLLKRHP